MYKTEKSRRKTRPKTGSGYYSENISMS